MKTKNLFSAGMLSIALFFAACGGGNTTETAESSTETMESTEETMPAEEHVHIDLTASAVMWKGEMMGMYAHEGTVSLSEGHLTMSGDNITAGNFTVDMTSITPTDENYNAEEGNTPEKLIGHLSTGDFFDVENNPTATFEITSFDGTSATGNLTVRGKSNEETVENISISSEGGKKVINGTLTFDRKKYDVAFDHPVKEMVLSDNIELTIKLMGS